MEDELFLTLFAGVIAVLICVLWGLACSAIVRSKGYDKHEQNIYFFLGFFLNIIGVIIVPIFLEISFISFLFNFGTVS